MKGTYVWLAILVVIAGVKLYNYSAEPSVPTATPEIPVINTYTPIQTSGNLILPSNSYNSTYYTDDDYEYNYRTGYSGDYSYNYSAEGYGNDSGEYVYGDVDTEGKYGEGYLYDEDGNEIYVETEWVDYGVLEATDEYGNTYELEVD